MNIRYLWLLLLAAVLIGGCAGNTERSYELASGSVQGIPEEDAEKAEDAKGTEADSMSPEADASEKSVFVYVCGAVMSPGVYELPDGSRVYEAVAAAGGLREDADEKCLNQAELLHDGQQITVYTEDEAAAGLPESLDGTGSEGKINLNTAGKEQLMTLPGIGETKAEAILDYREKQGNFSDIEEVKNIEGIKEKVFEKIKDLIEV